MHRHILCEDGIRRKDILYPDNCFNPRECIKGTFADHYTDSKTSRNRPVRSYQAILRSSKKKPSQ